MYDVIIIGGGPAGVSAAVNAKILNKNYLWLASAATSKKVERAELIKNYIGLPSVTGRQLAWTMKNHAESMGVELTRGVATGVYETEGKFAVLAGDKDYEAKSIILCLGVQSVKETEGEESFLGRGVSYCATCDGFLYKDKTIAVVSYDKSFEHEIEYLCGIAKKVYVMPFYGDYDINFPNAEVVLKVPTRFSGDMRLRKVEFKDAALEVDGAFVLKSSIAPSTLVHGLEIVDGHIRVDEKRQTNIEGIFAAGDCTGLPYQYIKAAGEGNSAMYFCNEYLNGKK